MPMPVAFARAFPLNRSNTIANGGSPQPLLSANPNRLGWAIQNQSTADLWVGEFGAAAASQPSLLIAAGKYYECPAHGCGTGALSIFGATSGQSFYAKEW